MIRNGIPPSFVYDFSVLSPMFFVNKNSENIFEKILKKHLTFVVKLAIITLAVADVAELADAHGSGPCESNFMGVQVPSSAPKRTVPIWVLFFFCFRYGT